MSTVGTLYDETIKNGCTKLLSAQVVTNVSVVDFVAPLSFALGYRTFLFDFDNLKCSTDSNRLVAYASTDGGASWGGDYLWSFIRVYTHSAADFYGSVALGGGYRANMFVGDTQWVSGYISGFYYFHRQAAGAGGIRVSYGEVIIRHPSVGVTSMQHSQANWFGGDVNAIRFTYPGSLMSGTIRCYGLKTGSN
jgi:hypothetical protein